MVEKRPFGNICLLLGEIAESKSFYFTFFKRPFERKRKSCSSRRAAK